MKFMPVAVFLETAYQSKVRRRYMDSQEPPIEQPGEEPTPELHPEEIPTLEQQPGEKPGINPDQREQSRSDMVEPQMPPPVYPQQGYVPQQGYSPPQGYYRGPEVAPRRRRGPWLGCLIAFIIIVLLCLGASLVGTLLGFGLGFGGSFRSSVTEPARTFTVSTNPALMLTSNAGSVTVNRGSANNRIIVQARKY